MIYNKKICEKENFHCGASVLDPYFRKGIRNPCCLNHLINCLDFTVGLLNQFKIKYWLDCATLLGQVRNNGVLPWDLDIDFSVFEKDLELFLEKSDYIKNMGFWFCFRNIEDPVNTIRTNVKEFTGKMAVFKIQTSFFNKTHIDLYSCKIEDDFVIRASSTWPAPIFPSYLIEELEICNGHQQRVFIPKEKEKYLNLLYGEK